LRTENRDREDGLNLAVRLKDSMGVFRNKHKKILSKALKEV
jgi:hypothetical protein